MEKTSEHKKSDHCCTCDGCHWGMGDGMRRHGPLRFLLIILGAMVIFWCGLKLGTIKGYMMNEFRSQSMMRGRYEVRDGRVMGTYYGINTPEATTKSASSTTTSTTPSVTPKN